MYLDTVVDDILAVAGKGGNSSTLPSSVGHALPIEVETAVKTALDMVNSMDIIDDISPLNSPVVHQYNDNILPATITVVEAIVDDQWLAVSGSSGMVQGIQPPSRNSQNAPGKLASNASTTNKVAAGKFCQNSVTHMVSVAV